MPSSELSSASMSTRTPKTRRGQVSREKLLDSAASLFLVSGVNATSVDDILEAADMGKSQFYHYFSAKDEVVAAVVERQMDRVIDYLAPHVERMHTWEDVERWAEAMPGLGRLMQELGCPVAVIAADCSPGNEMVTTAVRGALRRFVGLHWRAFERLKQSGVLREELDPVQTAQFAGTVLQGSMMLTRIFGSSEHLSRGFRQFLDYLQQYRRS